MPIKDHAGTGGRKRAESLTRQRRREIAIAAAAKRWRKKRKPKPEPEQPEPANDSAQQPEPTKQPEAAKPTHMSSSGKHCPPSTTSPVADMVPLLTAERKARIDRADARLRGHVGGFCAPY